MSEFEQHQKFLQEAITLARENVATGRGGPFGAVIVKNGEIIARGCNQVLGTHDPTMHAEVAAIREACKKLGHFELKDCIIYASAEPCPMCLGAIYWARPKALYYAADKKLAAKAGFDDSFIYKEIALPKNKRKIKTTKINLPQDNDPFEAWAKNTTKTEY